ncbi:MAG: carboxypeptidase regulatory-like domain-containing protein [Candidatus Magnetomorum sp.]|nr:carboxypeptidase regulatory-like domain-containing protein [Candidatus Magnetomorum sp.]
MNQEKIKITIRNWRQDSGQMLNTLPQQRNIAETSRHNDHKRQSGLIWSWCLVFIVFCLVCMHTADAGAEYFLFDPVISSAGGNVSVDNTHMGLFAGMPFGNYDMKILSDYQSIVGSGFVLWEHMLRSISGQIVNENGNGIPDVTVSVRKIYSSDNRVVTYAETKTDADGYYKITRLPARADLTLMADPADTYLSQFYNGKDQWELADALSTLPGNLEQINIVLHEPPENGITGQIVDKMGTGISDLTVSLCSENLELTQTTQTNSNGLYSFRGIIPSSDYKLSVWSPAYQTFVYYQSENNSVTHPDQAAQITVGNELISDIFIIIDPDKIVYYISASSGDNGNISPSGQIAATYLGNQAFVFTPDDGAIISNVWIDNIAYGPISEYTLTNIHRQGHTINVEFEFPHIQVTSGPNGQIQPEGLIQVNAGDNKTFTIQPDNGYDIHDVFIDGISVGPQDEIILTNIQKHYTIESIFKAIEGFDIPIHFDHTSLNIQTNDNVSITLTSDQSPYTLSVAKSHNLLIHIQPEITHYISSILINDEIQALNTTILMTDIQEAFDINISCLPIVVETSFQGSGAIEPSGIISLKQGQNQSFSIIPASGYYIQSLIVDGLSVSPQDTFTFWNIQEAHTINAIFQAQEPLTLSFTVNEGGTLTALDYRRIPIQSATGPNAYTVQTLPDSRIIVHVAPSHGFRLSDVMMNGQSKGAVSELNLNNIQSSIDISGIFEPLPVYSLTVTASDGGTITPFGTIQPLQGERTDFTIKAESGYHIQNVVFNNQSMGPLSQFAFTASGDPNQNYTLSAVFEPDAIRQLSGQILFEHTPVENAIVYLSFSEQLYTATSNENGFYSISNLPLLNQGQLWVDPGEHYAASYYSDNISTIAGDLNDLIISVERIYQGKIKGRVQFSAMENKNPGIQVQAISDTDHDYLIATTDANGFYTFTQMVPGAYIIVVQDTDLNTDFYYAETGTVVSAIDADYITLGIDATSDAVDITLTPGGTIRGTIYQEELSGDIVLKDILVTARSVDDNSSQSALSDEYGAFTITGLNFVSEHSDYTKTGYIVEVPPNNYPYQAYPQVSKPSDAKPVYTGISDIYFFLTPYATISGVITGPPNASVDIVTRSLSTPGNFAETQIVLSKEGKSPFTLSRLISHDDYVINAYPDQYPVITHPEFIDVSYGSQTDIQITVPFGTQLTGRITDDQGNMISHTPVQIFSNNALYRASTTDENGNYTITGLLQESYSVHVDSVSRLPFSETVVITEADNQLLNIQLKSGYTLKGSVSYHQNPVPGILVEVNSDINYRQFVIADGFTYTINGLLPGQYTATISGDTYESVVQSFVIENQDVIKDFSLEKAYRHVSGFIYNMNKNETAQVRAWSSTGSDKIVNVKANNSDEPVSFIINGLIASDDYIIEVKSTEHPLHFYNDKFGLKKADKLNLSTDNADNLSFSLVPAFEIYGTVSVPVFPMNVIETSVLVHATSAFYGNDGVAVVDFITPGTKNYTIALMVDSDDYHVSVQSEHFVNHFFDNVKKEISATSIDTQVPEPAHFTMTGGASISGTIVDIENNSLSDLLVLGWSLKTGSQGSTRTNDNGEFMIRGLVQSDDFLVQTWNANNVTFFYNSAQTVRSQKQAQALSTMTSDVSDLILTILTVQKLTGKITDTKNKPIENVMVTAESEITMSDGSTFTDKNGKYEIDSLLSGNDYVVKTVHNKLISQEKSNVATGDVVDFKLEHKPVYSLTGRVVDDSESVIPRSTVELWSKAKRDYVGGAVLTDSDGAFELLIDSPGTYTIAVTPPADSSVSFRSLPLSIEKDMHLNDIVLPIAYEMSGIVTYTDQMPVVNATVILRSVKHQYVKHTQTNDLGGYQFSNIPNSDDYQLTVVPLLGVGKEKNDQVPGNNVDFILFRSSFIEGIITDKSTGQPVKQALVEVYSKSKPDILGFSEFTYTDEEGFYRFNSLRVNDDNGNRVLDYAITVFADGYLSSLKTMRKTGDTVNIALEQDTKGIRRLTGTVSSATECDFYIVMLMKDGSKFERFAKTDADGNFAFDKLNPNRQYGFTLTPYIGDSPQSMIAIDQLYSTGGHVTLNYEPEIKRNRLIQVRLDLLYGSIISLKSLTHLTDVVSNLPKISFNWDFNGFYEDLTGYYTLLNTSPTHQFTVLNVVGQSPITQRVYTSHEIVTEYDTYYFHIAPVYIDGTIGDTQTIGPYPIDTRAPYNINVIVPEIASSLQIPVQLAVTGAYEMYISPYNFGENGSWEPWQPATVWMLFDVPSKQYLYIQFRDRAGNIANTVAETIYREQIMYTIRTEKQGVGKIDPADPLTGEIQVNEGNNQTVRFNASEGYEIYQVSVDGSAVDLVEQTYTFENIQTDHDLEVRFRSLQHTIEISSSEGGWISPCIFVNQCTGNAAFSGQISVNSGSDLRFTIVPSFGYEIVSILVDGEVKPVSQTVQTFAQINSNHSLYASFRKTKTSPLLNDIPNMIIDENSNDNAFVINVRDAETLSTELIIEFHSDNEGLIPSSNIIEKSIQGHIRTYSLTPSANRFGVAAITVKVTDTDQMTAMKTFNVQVNNVYYAPTISSIDNQSINQNEISGPHPLTISSQDTDLLTLSAQSSNHTLVPLDRILFSNNDQTGQAPFTVSVNADQAYPISLTVEPVKGQFGNAIITITVENQQQMSSSRSFQIEVICREHPPELSLIANQMVDENTATGKIPFSISDADGGQFTITATSSNIEMVQNIIFYNGVQEMASVMYLALNPEIPQTLYVQVIPETDQWGACNIDITATDQTNLSDISRFALTVKQYIPKIKTYYGFVYDEYFMGINDVQINLVQPEITGYSTVVLTQLGTGLNGQTGAGYFVFNLPESDEIFTFNAIKTGFNTVSFDSTSAYIDLETEHSVLFKPLYLSNCTNNQFISGSIDSINTQSLDLYLIAENTVIAHQQVNGDKFSFCVGDPIADSYTLIASLPDQYTVIEISGMTFPVKNTVVKPIPIEKTDPITITDGSTVVIKRTIEINPIGGQIVVINKTIGSGIGTIEIPVLKNECVDNNLSLSYQIITDSEFSNNEYTNGSDETLISTNLNSVCKHVEMEIEMPIDRSVSLTDFRAGRYNIYAADSKVDLLAGKYRFIVEGSDIISVSGGKVRYRTDESAVFGVGRISECEDCEPCVDCDQKPETLCFVGAVGNGVGDLGILWLMGLFVVIFQIFLSIKDFVYISIR